MRTKKRKEFTMIDYNIDLMKQVIDYNKKRYNAFKNQTEFVVNEEFEKILNARNHKVQRVKRRFLYLLVRYKYIWFCTFTFSDKYINKSEKTKRNKIKYALNNYDFKYILNIDYGKQTMRQHFHCIVATNQDIDLHEYFSKEYTGGFSKSILCKDGLEDFVKVSKYINKLVNHCLKASTNKQRLVYNFKGYDDFCPESHDITIQYNLEYEYMFKYVPLLDKGDITGKNLIE